MAGTVKLDLEFQQGATFSKTFQLTNSDGTAKNLTGYSGRLQVRTSVAAVTPVVDATTANGKVVITALTGLVTVTIPASETAAMVWRSGFWDLEVFETTPGIVLRPFEGFASLKLEVTR